MYTLTAEKDVLILIDGIGSKLLTDVDLYERIPRRC